MPARPRPRPGQKTDKKQSESIGKGDKESRQQAEAAAKRTEKVVESSTDDHTEPSSERWLLNARGVPFVKISMTAAELIPTGKFANASVGPAQITMMIDPEDPAPISDDHRENIVAALNHLADMVGEDTIGVQRSLVLESIQGDNDDNGS